MNKLIELEKPQRERAILVGLTRDGDRWITDDHLQELALLADTAGAEVVDRLVQEKERVDPAYFVGKGKAQVLSQLVEDKDANIVIFDDDLSPAQVRNLEKMVGKKIVDRSGLILDIFARRAKTREARTQVELAQLNYLLPRLTRQWSHLSRQVGGIGTRGPGETQLEVDRRLIRKRISVLTRALEKIARQRAVRRRGRGDALKVALVGYTNAGKSTLMNCLTESDVFVEDRLFATLDPTVRRLEISGQDDVLLIDTVGFIRKLPHNLVASFKSTLEEAADADLLLHVVDVSHPALFDHIAVVRDVLRELGIDNKPTVLVFNKIDVLTKKMLLERLRNEYADAVFVSAARGLFLNDLKEGVTKLLRQSVQEMEVRIGVEQAATIARIYELARAVTADYGDTEVLLHVRADADKASLIKRLLASVADN